MPQLVKAGKYTYGWSRVGRGGKIILPPEALDDYHLQEGEKLVVVPGSKKSGGFSLVSEKALKKSKLADFFLNDPAILENGIHSEGEWKDAAKRICWVEIHGGCVEIPLTTLDKYGVRAGDKLLVIRGSGLGVGFAVRGPIVETAEDFPGLEIN